jgi:hypothetical protein
MMEPVLLEEVPRVKEELPVAVNPVKLGEEAVVNPATAAWFKVAQAG